ncbi:hypothetical protein DS832_07105 [Bombilactobacillus bombi]|uniref:Phage protein n=1 Tax=Bombilactobacillus bombi TaxID=1303590 RepID=A0A417Z670_9LACO|nr:hypothetical protein [Bombilactobacillus bombi]RHW46110.1 hypothetical protein DS832_07105 [Bombilactobacillus bombi]
MDMTNEAIKAIQEMAIEAAREKIIQANNQSYAINGKGDVQLIIPHDKAQEPVELTSLTGLVDFVKSINERKEQLYVHVSSFDQVEVYTHLDSYGRREKLAVAHALLPEIVFDRFIASEAMNIMLQSQFEETNDQLLLLKVIGNLKEKTVHQANDDGVSQAVSVKTGIASIDSVKVPNPVKLSPYRTFNEVAQPESKFIFRMQNGMQCAIFEADGGAWKLEAMQSIKEYLTRHLGFETDHKRIMVIA